jgi:hypothetical protein
MLTITSVWAQVVKSLNNVQSIFAGNGTVEAGLKKFVLQLVTPAIERIGWEVESKEDILNSRLRSLLISTAGGAGHKP